MLIVYITPLIGNTLVNTRNSSTLMTEQGYEAMATTSISDVDALLETLPVEYKTVVKEIIEIISSQLSNKIVNVHRELTEKDKEKPHRKLCHNSEAPRRRSGTPTGKHRPIQTLRYRDPVRGFTTSKDDPGEHNHHGDPNF